MRDTKDNQAQNGDLAQFLVLPLAFNGVGWDRVYNNTEAASVASAARIVSGNSEDFTNPNAKGGIFVLDLTAFSGTGPTVQLIVEGKDPVSGGYYPILTSAVIAGAVAKTVFRVYPLLVAVANLTVQDMLPRTWRLRWVIAGTTPSLTFSVGSILIP